MKFPTIKEIKLFGKSLDVKIGQKSAKRLQEISKSVVKFNPSVTQEELMKDWQKRLSEARCMKRKIVKLSDIERVANASVIFRGE